MARANPLVAAKPPRHRVAWIVSYADIMTIILTFFVLILSISRVSAARYEALAGALGNEAQRTLSDIQTELNAVIAELGLEEHVRTELTDDGLYVELENSVLFGSGEAELEAGALEMLEPLGRELTELEPQYGVVVEGYTDDVPIHTNRFQSNWELSASRAIYVREQIVAAGFEPRRISIQGFADTRTGESEATESLEDVRAAQRRVVLRVVEMIDRESTP